MHCFCCRNAEVSLIDAEHAAFSGIWVDGVCLRIGMIADPVTFSVMQVTADHQLRNIQLSFS